MLKLAVPRRYRNAPSQLHILGELANGTKVDNSEKAFFIMKTHDL